MKILASIIVVILALPIGLIALPLALSLYIMKGIVLGIIEFCEVLTGGRKFP
jgi:hypothetical protein